MKQRTEQKRKAINLIFYADERVLQTKVHEAQGPKEPFNSWVFRSPLLVWSSRARHLFWEALLSTSYGLSTFRYSLSSVTRFPPLQFICLQNLSVIYINAVYYSTPVSPSRLFHFRRAGISFHSSIDFCFNLPTRSTLLTILRQMVFFLCFCFGCTGSLPQRASSLSLGSAGLLWSQGLHRVSLVAAPAARRGLAPRPGIEQTHTPCIGRWILSHWTTRKVPKNYFNDQLCNNFTP